MPVRTDSEITSIVPPLRLEERIFLLGHGRRPSLITEEELRSILGALQEAMKVFDQHEFPLSSAETRAKGLLVIAHLHVADSINQKQFEAQCGLERDGEQLTRLRIHADLQDLTQRRE